MGASIGARDSDRSTAPRPSLESREKAVETSSRDGK